MRRRAYICSDLHGEYSLFKDMIEYMDLKEDEDLYLLEDYCDYGKETYPLLNYLQALSNTYYNITCLIGNHEEMFLNYVYSKEEIKNDYLLSGFGMDTIRSFLNEEELEILSKQIINSNQKGNISDIVSDYAVPIIKKKCGSLLSWLLSLKKYVEIDADKIIGVHAGISEDSFWQDSTTDEEYIWKYPPQTGRFSINGERKVIIAGHVSTVEFSREDEFSKDDIYFDQQSHLYIANHHTGCIPLLIIDKISVDQYKLTGVRCDKHVSFDAWETYSIGVIHL